MIEAQNELPRASYRNKLMENRRKTAEADVGSEYVGNASSVGGLEQWSKILYR
jgi:hypothetical protein